MAMLVFDQYPDPLIGLHHVYEYWLRDVPSYWCCLCETNCGAEMRKVISHVTGEKHRINYIRMHYMSYLEVIESSSTSERDSLLLEYSRIIETAEGRSKIEVKDKNRSSRSDLQVSAFGSEPQSDSKNVRSQPEVQPEMCSFPDSSIGCVLHNLALRSGAKNTAELLHKLSGTLIRNEEEVAKALEVANILTRSLLEYRLTSSSPK